MLAAAARLFFFYASGAGMSDVFVRSLTRLLLCLLVGLAASGPAPNDRPGRVARREPPCLSGEVWEAKRRVPPQGGREGAGLDAALSLARPSFLAKSDSVQQKQE